jgi:hypothetical protein
MHENNFIDSFIIKQSYITVLKNGFNDIDSVINDERKIYLYLLEVESSQKIVHGPFTMERTKNLDMSTYYVLQVIDDKFNDFIKNNLIPNVFGWFISTLNSITIDIISDYGMIYWYNINIISKLYPDMKYKCHNPHKITNNKWWVGNYGVLYDTGIHTTPSYMDIMYYKSVYLTCEVDIVGPYKNYLDICTLLLSPDNNISNVMPQEIITYILVSYCNSLYS